MSIDIRQATPSDAAAACTVLRRSIEEGCKADHAQQPAILQAWLGNKTLQNVLAWFSSPSNYAVVAERDGELAGLALLTPAGKLALCYVVPEGLRAGVGRRLLEAVEREARSRNISKLHMHSPASASPFFERLGYVNAGKDKACFGLECDFLWKQLDASTPPLCKRFCKCGE
ncbi:GNAT family N-acetyltransferase [Massilia forsythiae]|uniref:GNAT family N-acetyltransferase n=1 Tax=Massilia forsythiae TaxID=2728020 RepID=A0A7Z2VYC0_9BURK|nr:GNAT family N-acetyltransferase [Massilia forsythiae]QJE01681.1 GNAT family N-acetyltransferase [Massilia forsythiae]